MRVSRTLSDDIKYIYDCVSRVIGPRIFLAILSLPPSLSLTLLLFYFSLGLRRPQSDRDSISRISSLPSDLLLLPPPPPLATPFDRIIRRRSKGRLAFPDAANEKNHGKGGEGGGGGGSILSCRRFISNWNVVRGVYLRFEG